MTLLLADFAQVADGKLTVVGGGWNITGPQPSPSALAVIFEVPWDQTNRRHQFKLELMDADGGKVMAESPDSGPVPVCIEGEFEVGRPPGIKPGSSMNFPLALNLPPQPIRPGQQYEWRLAVNGETDDDWRLGFRARPFPAA
ncbi:MAG TPA: hypothetical protein VFD31_03275 [Thermoleophilaceae bacterium]|nr:hypothetical protein [Thermoleophilaceae bacterium]